MDSTVFVQQVLDEPVAIDDVKDDNKISWNQMMQNYKDCVQREIEKKSNAWKDWPILCLIPLGSDSYASYSIRIPPSEVLKL